MKKEEWGVFTLQSSTYRSQRCSSCGWVCKSNRKLKGFKCKFCSFSSDADLNAAKNLALDLPEISYDLRMKKLNKEGFFWNLGGFNFEGGDLTVPLSQNKLLNGFP